MSLRTDVEAILDAQYDTSEWSIRKNPNQVFLLSDYKKHQIGMFSNLRERFELYRIEVEKVGKTDELLGSHTDTYWTVYKFSRDGEEQFLKFYGHYYWGTGIEYTNRTWTKIKVVTKFEFHDE